MTGDCVHSIEDSELLNKYSGVLIPYIYAVWTLLAGKAFHGGSFLMKILP